MTLSTTPRAGLLIGHGAIAAYLNTDPRHATQMVAEGIIPTFRVGDLIVARRDRLMPLEASEIVPDRLEGISEIAAYLNATIRHAEKMIAAGLPTEGVGPDAVASRAAIAAWLSQMEGAARG